ncbi:MAG: hypothetical protein K8T25_00920 [Planctomycetia bacterium]|nr:hypothetical protein [Planctomycetia bacterium]
MAHHFQYNGLIVESPDELPGNPVWPPPGGFAERQLLTAIPYYHRDFHREIDHLDMEHLEFWMFSAAHGLFSYPGLDTYELAQHGLCTEVIRYFLGNEWTFNVIHGLTIRDSFPDSKKFLWEDDKDNPNASCQSAERVLNLAECLYNFRDTPGMKYRLSQMMLDDLESAVGEMDCARLMAAPHLQFNFIVPVGKMGSDYEAEFVVPSGALVYCEIKTKKQKTQPRAQAAWATLDRARKQLPKGKPGVIFLSLPQSWVTNPCIGDELGKAIEKLFRQSARVVAVKLKFELWPKNIGLIFFKQHTVFNERSPLLSEEIKSALLTAGALNNPHWVKFQQLVINRLPQILAAYTRWKPPNGVVAPDLRVRPRTNPTSPG